jgi:hypothetical protein
MAKKFVVPTMEDSALTAAALKLSHRLPTAFNPLRSNFSSAQNAARRRVLSSHRSQRGCWLETFRQAAAGNAVSMCQFGKN